mgnify:CR=1 FL=1
MFTMAAIAAFAFPAAALAQDDWRAEAAARLPDTGELHMRLMFNGAEDGFMRLGWQRRYGTIHVYDRSMLASGELYETMTVDMRDGDFYPVSASIRFHQQAAIMTVDTEISEGRATGLRALLVPLQGEQEAPVDLDIPDGTLPRAATFILAPYLALSAGDAVSYDWYAPMANAVATVTVTAFEGGAVDTPAGRYEETLRLELRGASPENDIYVSDGEIVRIDIVGQDMSFLRLPDPEPAAQ